MRKYILTLILISIGLMLSSQEYKEPEEYIKKIFDAPQPPYLSIVQYSNFAVEANYRRYQTLEQLAEKKLHLAGKEISPRLNAEIERWPGYMVNFVDLETGERRKIDLPEDIKIRQRIFNNDYSKMAVSYEAENGIKLFIIDVKTGKIKHLNKIMVNDAFGYNSVSWLNDNKTLLVKSIPKRGIMTDEITVPTAPIVQSTNGKKSTVRTYQNLLQNQHDEELFEYYFTSQLLLVNSKNGKAKKIGEPAIYMSVEFSPNNEYLLASRMNKPYSYLLPYYYFPKSYLVFDKAGNLVKELSNQPLQDQIPIGGTRKEPRNYNWQPLKEATLVWVEALDEGDPKIEVENRDRVVSLSAPFTGEPKELFRTKYRYNGIDWSSDVDELIYTEYDRDNFWIYSYLYNLKTGAKEQLEARSYKDIYNDPGDLIYKKTKNGLYVFLKNGEKVYRRGNGATPEGKYPFLAEFDLKTKESKTLFRCKEGFYEKFIAFTNKELDEIVIYSQSKTVWPNYYKVDLNSGERTQITFYKNPNPQIESLPSELVYYSRKDSIPLSGKLYLPPNYKEGDKLPLIIHAYPEEFVDSATASQVSNTDNIYPKFSGASLKYLALEGYAVLQNASIPIIGDPETVNDTFIEQLNSSVEAAIDYLDGRGIIDRERVGIIGHSYGAFMVANVLAHSDLCAVGIAKSGAYNRTLTPFGFQSERRTFWEAKDFYFKVSPFMYADKIKEPLLLIHGEDDPNSGTFPIQSKRMYHALKGNGGTAKLVLLPLEGHGYAARKSNLHVLAEMIEWFNKYLK